MISTVINRSTKEKTWEAIKGAMSKTGFMSSELATGYTIDPKISDFKFGNVDSLMLVNDQIIKLDTSVEGLLKKIER